MTGPWASRCASVTGWPCMSGRLKSGARSPSWRACAAAPAAMSCPTGYIKSWIRSSDRTYSTGLRRKLTRALAEPVPLQQAQGPGALDGLEAAMCVELAVDILEVIAHRAGGHEQPPGDLGGGQPAG